VFSCDDQRYITEPRERMSKIQHTLMNGMHQLAPCDLRRAGNVCEHRQKKSPLAFNNKSADNRTSVNYTNLHAQPIPIPGEHSPGGYSLLAAMVCEVVMTMMFLVIILGSTDKRAPAGFAPIAIGLGLTLIHLISIPVSNTSVNPARSTGVAIYVGGWALAQLWVFWLAPIAGAALGALAYNVLRAKED